MGLNCLLPKIHHFKVVNTYIFFISKLPLNIVKVLFFNFFRVLCTVCKSKNANYINIKNKRELWSHEYQHTIKINKYNISLVIFYMRFCHEYFHEYIPLWVVQRL